MEVRELVKRDLRSSLVEEEPPSISEYSCAPDIYADDHVAEEEPFADEGFSAIAWRNTHDAVVCGVEA